MALFTPDVLAQLRQAEKIPHNPEPRDFIRNAPTRGLLIITDGVTPSAVARAHTPTFHALAARGAQAADARTIFPTITGPAHTSLLTGARVGTHGFLYPKMLDAYGNRLLDFSEGLMRAETVAEAWRPNGIVSVALGSRFLRGADAMVTEGVVGEDFEDITDRAMAAVREWEPHFLMVVYYVGDTFAHLFGPEADETLAAIEQMDAMTARILDTYAEKNFLDSTVVAVLADHGHAQVNEMVKADFVERVGALPHGRLALTPQALSESAFAELMNDARVEDIWSRDELELLGAQGARWGENIIHLKEGLMFPHSRELRGFHGAWSRIEQHIPLIVGGAGIRAGAELGTCEIIDLAPTFSLLLGGMAPEQSQGRILWEILDIASAPETHHYVSTILKREELLVEFKMAKREFASGSIHRQVFATRREEFKRSANALLTEMERERRKLSEWVSR